MYNELIDALQCTRHFALYQDCYERNCYANSGKGLYCNIPKLMADAADAIERLQSDLAKKDSQLAEWKNAWRIANSLYKSAQAEIDELRAYQHELVERIEQLKAELSELKQAEPTGPNEPKGDN